MTKTILVYTDARSVSGIGRFVAALLSALVDAGYRAACAQVREDNPLTVALAKKGVAYFPLPGDPDKDRRAFIADTATPAAIFNAVKPDIVVFANGHPLSTVGSVAVAAERGIPHIIREGLVAAAILAKTETQKEIIRRHYAQARAVVCDCRDGLQILSRHYKLPPDFGTVIPSGAADAFFRPRDAERRAALRAEWRAARDTVVCFTPGKLEPVKGHAVQLAALPLLNQKPLFVWAGEGSLRQSILEHPNADRIRLLGHVWNVDELLDAADIFVLTSFHEGTPYALVEAMAKGLPIIATNAGGIAEALGDYGRLLPWPHDVAATGRLLAHEIERLAEDPLERQRLGRAAHARAVAHFTARQELSRYLELLT